MLSYHEEPLRLIGWTVVDLFRSRATLEAEIWTLRQQINVLRRTAPTKHAFSAIDRLIFVSLYWLFPKIRDALAIVKPEMVVRWHRATVGRPPWGRDFQRQYDLNPAMLISRISSRISSAELEEFTMDPGAPHSGLARMRKVLLTLAAEAAKDVRARAPVPARRSFVPARPRA